jgi:hypothetical protein
MCFLVYRWLSLAIEARWFLWSKDVGPVVVEPSLFSNYIDGRRQFLSKTVRRHPLIEVPQQHVPRCVQHACLSTHKALLTMVLS